VYTSKGENVSGKVKAKQSELRLDHRECSCDMRVRFSLLINSQYDRASQWDVLDIVFQVIGAMDILVVCHAEGGPLSKCALIGSREAGPSGSKVAEFCVTPGTRIDAARASGERRARLG
jgi:hypothetical protein